MATVHFPDQTQCIATPNERYTNDAIRGSKGHHPYHAEGGDVGSGSGNAAVDPWERTRVGTVRTFALWIMVHYTERPDDRVNVASHGGLKVKVLLLIFSFGKPIWYGFCVRVSLVFGGANGGSLTRHADCSSSGS